MPTEVPRRSGPRNPWLLPLILGLIVVVAILAFVFGPKIKAAVSPTATPVRPTPTARTVIVTATPGGPTPTPGGPTATPGEAAGALPSATPGGAGASTPLPGLSPVATVSGLVLGMISQPAHRVIDVQHAVDAQQQPYLFYLHPRQVVQNDLPHYGFTQGFQITSPPPSPPAPTPTPHTGADGRPVISFLVSYQGQTYTVKVAQPGTRGPTGIWTIVTILPGRQ